MAFTTFTLSLFVSFCLVCLSLQSEFKPNGAAIVDPFHDKRSLETHHERPSLDPQESAGYQCHANTSNDMDDAKMKASLDHTQLASSHPVCDMCEASEKREKRKKSSEKALNSSIMKHDVPHKIRNAFDIMKEAEQHHLLTGPPYAPPSSSPSLSNPNPDHATLSDTVAHQGKDAASPLEEAHNQAPETCSANSTASAAQDTQNPHRRSAEADQGSHTVEEEGTPIFLFSFLAQDATLKEYRKSGFVSPAGMHSPNPEITDPFDDAHSEIQFASMPFRDEDENWSWEKSARPHPPRSSFPNDKTPLNEKPSNDNTTTGTLPTSTPSSSFSARVYSAMRELGDYIREFLSHVSIMFSDQISLHLIVRNVLAFAAAASVLVVYTGFMYSAISLPVLAFSVFEDSLKNLPHILVSLFLSLYIIMTIAYVTANGQMVRHYTETVTESRSLSLPKAAMLASLSIFMRLLSSPIVVVPFILPASLVLDFLVRHVSGASAARGLSLRHILTGYAKTSSRWAFRIIYVFSLLSFMLLSVLASTGYIHRHELYDMREEL